MTKTVEEVRRELFLLKILGSQGDADVSRKPNGSYSNYYLECIWQGFNAALDAVEIQLPFSNDDDLSDQIEECRAAIEQTGLGLRVK
jgi:hypothetical protein